MRKVPMFSLITVCFNAETDLVETMDSVLAQSTEDYEYIIIDGFSNDGTRIVLQEYELKFQGRMRWFSEADQGIYDAMNKGIQRANGKYINFINAGDLFCENALEKIVEMIENGEVNGPDIIYGDAICVYHYGMDKISKLRKASPCISKKTLKKGMGVIHQSIFAKREVFNKVGIFDLQYSIGADWDWLIRSVLSGVKLLHTSTPICYFDTSGVSSKVHNWQRHIIRKKNRLYKWFDWNLVIDLLNIGTMIQLLIGTKQYNKLRYMCNNGKDDGMTNG